MKLDKILVPHDYSEYADYALTLAVDIAKSNGAAITILHVIDLQSDSYEKDSSSQERKELVKKSEAKLRTLSAQFTGVEFSLDVKLEEELRDLVDFIKPIPTDLIVMGSRGAHGLEEIIMGSNTEKVVRKADAPVFVVKRAIRLSEIQKVLFASSFKKLSDAIVDSIYQLTKALEAELHLLKVVSVRPTEGAIGRIKGEVDHFIEKHKLEGAVPHTYTHISTAEGIMEFAQKLPTDLICLSTHGRTGFARFLLGSVAEDVANATEYPVLTFNKNFE
jgi:nucleotide-binding universal stress UspA family protein